MLFKVKTKGLADETKHLACGTKRFAIGNAR